MEKKNKLFVDPSPHIHHYDSVSKIMWIVFISLLPAAAWGVFYFGLPALNVILASVFTCLITEAVFSVWRKNSWKLIGDGSAAVTGILLAFTLPPYVPLYVPITGSFFAIGIVKQLFGGIGFNIMNPALAGRVFVMFAWVGAMTSTAFFIPQADQSFYYKDNEKSAITLEAISSATPLGMLKNYISGKISSPIPDYKDMTSDDSVIDGIPASFPKSLFESEILDNQDKNNQTALLNLYQLDSSQTEYQLKKDLSSNEKETLKQILNISKKEKSSASLLYYKSYTKDLFLGKAGGSIGEVSVLFIFLGGLWLLKRRYIYWHIPAVFIGSVAALTFLYALSKNLILVPEYGAVKNAFLFAYLHVLSGGLILGAFYMATDMITTPLTLKGQIIMSFGIGFLTFIIRIFGGYPEGVMFAILLMELLVPFIDKMSKPKIYGWKNNE
ncbi:MAG TPA: hypothetical protein DHW82_12255 [Spirochaetia bacterium]|nr:MAG: hypothetical protein A2Y41_02895 [Spirochaetes bacterium GWB1_36_13]HCL57763.1 hypothetical protein [Spirochaetia bacterium]